MHPHIHHRPDGIVVICSRPWCARALHRVLVRRALVSVGLLAVVAASGAFGPKRQAVLALLVIAALVVLGARMLGAHLERTASARPRETGGTAAGAPRRTSSTW